MSCMGRGPSQKVKGRALGLLDFYLSEGLTVPLLPTDMGGGEGSCLFI